MTTVLQNNLNRALADLAQGKMVILIDDEKRENEGDLILSPQFVTPESINFMIQNAGGFICLAMTTADFDRLGIRMMTEHNRSAQQTPFGVSFEAARGVTTGVSASDRAMTIKTAVDPNSTENDIVMPGHVFPLRGKEGGVLVRQGHTEGGLDLMQLAGLPKQAVLCEIINKDGSMARGDQLKAFAKQFDLCLVSIRELIHYRLQHEKLIEKLSTALLPVRQHGEFSIHTYRSCVDQIEHIALVKGELNDAMPLVRLHSECLTGDVFGSVRCDCGSQLELSLAMLAEQGGVLLYLRQEGRGIGLANKIKAYALQDAGLDTVEANHELGFAADLRDYGFAAQMLRDLGIVRIRLLTNNPHKVASLRDYGIDVVDRLALEISPTSDNIRYLRTKRKKLGHLLTIEE